MAAPKSTINKTINPTKPEADDKVDETCSGAVASVAMPMGKMSHRVKEAEQDLLDFDHTIPSYSGKIRQDHYLGHRSIELHSGKRVYPGDRVLTFMGPGVVVSIHKNNDIQVKFQVDGKIRSIPVTGIRDDDSVLSAKILESIRRETTFSGKKAAADKLVESAESTRDAEVDRAMQYAQTHYPGIPPEDAFRKLVVRSLKHSEEDTRRTDERLNQLEQDLRDLERDVAGASEAQPKVDHVKESLYTRITGKPMVEGMFDIFKKPAKATPKRMNVTPEQRALIKKVFPETNAEMMWGRKENDDYVLPDAVHAGHGRGSITFNNVDGNLKAHVAYHTSQSDRINPKARPLTHFAADINGEEDLVKLRKEISEGVHFSKKPKATATAYDQGKRACGSDPSTDPVHLARKLPVEDRKEFVKGFNDEAKSRGINRYGDTGSSDLTHGKLKHTEFKRDMGVSEDKDPCWDGYKQLGMKKKDGKKGLSEWYRKSLGSTDEVISEFQKVIIPEMRLFGVQSNRLNHFTTLSSAIFEGAAKPADSMKELLATFKQLDQRKSIKISVGQKVSILNVVMAGNQIEVFGFKRPKTITRIHREPSDNKIIQLEFDNDSDDVWPRSPMAEFNGEPLVHSVFFQNETEVEKAIMMLELSKPDNVNIRYYVKEELNKNQRRAKQLGPTEKVGPKGAVGKLVGEDRVTKQVSEAIDDILRGTGF